MSSRLKTAAVTVAALALFLATAGRQDPLRTISYNIHGGGPVAATDEGKARIARMRSQDQYVARLALELQLHQPDIVTIQEARSEALMQRLADEMDMHLAYFPGGWRGKGWPEGISGALLTRFRIIEQQNCPVASFPKRPEKLFTRHFGRALLDTGDEQTVVYSAHLMPHSDNAAIRLDEIAEILAVMERDTKAGRSIIVQGDLNHGPNGEEYKAWLAGGMTDSFARSETAHDRTSPALEPRRRIDYILARGPIAGRLTRSRVLYEGAFRTYAEDPTSYAMSDHIPVFAEFAAK